MRKIFRISVALPCSGTTEEPPGFRELSEKTSERRLNHRNGVFRYSIFLPGKSLKIVVSLCDVALRYVRFPNEIKVGRPHLYYIIYLYLIFNVVNNVGMQQKNTP